MSTNDIAVTNWIRHEALQKHCKACAVGFLELDGVVFSYGSFTLGPISSRLMNAYIGCDRARSNRPAKQSRPYSYRATDCFCKKRLWENRVQGKDSRGIVEQRSFSAIELSILADIAAGYQSKEIAARIGRSKPTVENYVRMLCAKLGARSRPHLVACAYREGLLEAGVGTASA